jgi:hypothetical protein
MSDSTIRSPINHKEKWKGYYDTSSPTWSDWLVSENTMGHCMLIQIHIAYNHREHTHTPYCAYQFSHLIIIFRKHVPVALPI